MVERQARGDVYRFLFLDGELLDVVRRHPPTVTGDGESSVRDLIEAENRRRIEAGGDAGLSLITATLDAVFTLAASGLDLSSVPTAGARVQVKTVTNQGGPSDNHTVHEPVSPDLVAEARAAAAAVGVRLAGVDLITTDVTASLHTTGGVIIEVNGGPGLHHHYHVADREGATRVAVPILRRLLG
jgi:D-alanine-D-alanine ligase-like ATP-grasp enzyme